MLYDGELKSNKMRYFLHLAFKGTNYFGWQRQKAALGVQEVIEEKLSLLLRQATKIHPCGRTDAGVHASQFYVHFESEPITRPDFIYRMNQLLPEDIVIYELLPVVPKANAQLDAISRTYRYYFHTQKNPFLEERSAWYHLGELDVDKMKTAIDILPSYEDFRSMCLQPDAHNSTLCTIMNAHLEMNVAQNEFSFEITASRFLRGMIRLLVARIMDIGIGKISIDEFKNCLETGERVRFHTSAYPQGLFLAQIEYREDIFLP